MTSLNATFANLDSLQADLLIIGVLSGEHRWPRAALLLDWRLCGLLTQFFQQGVVSGARNELVPLATEEKIGAPNSLFWGLGELYEVTRYFPDSLKRLQSYLEKSKYTSCAFIVPDEALELVPSINQLLTEHISLSCTGIFAPMAR